MEYPNFFNTSIKDNLLIFDSNFENVINICKELDIYNYIMNLPNGFETVLVDNASNIDSDVKYMLAFTRVFLKKSKIILLNNVLDKVSRPISRKILKILEELKKEHTIIMITKDIKIMAKKYIDQVIMFAFGEVVGSGIHQELLKNNYKYKQLLKKM